METDLQLIRDVGDNVQGMQKWKGTPENTKGTSESWFPAKSIANQNFNVKQTTFSNFVYILTQKCGCTCSYESYGQVLTIMALWNPYD